MGHKSPGFTLIELTLAIVITAVMGLSVAGVTLSLSNAHEHSGNTYRSVQAGRTIMRNVGSTIREAKLVTACNERTVVLWANDANRNGQINPSELLVLNYDPQLKQLQRIQWDLSGISAALRVAIDMPIPLYYVTNATLVKNYLINSHYTRTRLMAEDVSFARFYVDQAAPMTRSLGLETTITRDDQSLGFRSAVSTRAGYESYVGVSDGDYVLMSIN